MSWWEQAILGFLCLIVFSFIAGFIDEALEQRRREKEREEREKWQLKLRGDADSEK